MLLKRQPMTAGDLAAEFEIAKSTMSAHFAVLKKADLVVSEKDGKTVIYQLKLSVLEEALLGFARGVGWLDRNQVDAVASGPAIVDRTQEGE